MTKAVDLYVAHGDGWADIADYDDDDDGVSEDDASERAEAAGGILG